MADPKEEEKIEKKVEETGAPKTQGELSDADMGQVAGGQGYSVSATGDQSPVPSEMVTSTFVTIERPK